MAALHALTHLWPPAQRVVDATDHGGKVDVPQIVGENLGVYNYRVDAEARLRKKMAIASDYAQSKTASANRGPDALKDMLAADPDAAVYIAFRPYLQEPLSKLRQIDKAKVTISGSSESSERKSAAIAALDRARADEIVNIDKTDRAVDLVLKRVHDRKKLPDWKAIASGESNGR